jgi:hypothetical protein
MSVTFMNWTSRVAIAGRVAESHRISHVQGDYHLPFGKTEARSEASKWLWQT